MSQPRFSDFLIWVGKALTNAPWNTNLQTIINYLTTDYDVTFGTVNTGSLTATGTVTANTFSGSGANLTNLPTASSSSIPYRLVGGLSKASGYPNFLTVTAADRNVTLSASTTNVFTAVINGTTVSVSTGLVLTGLTVAPSTNNTCVLTTNVLLNGGTWTLTEGEMGGTELSIQSAGSSITALNGTVQGYKVGATEYFMAYTNTTSSVLSNVIRGDTLGGSTRLALSTNNTITLQNINYIFLDQSQTLYGSTTYPKRVPTAPTATLNAYYFNTSDKKWYFCADGANWAVSNRILLGRVYCDTTSSRVVQCEDWDTSSWGNLNVSSLEYLTTTSINVRIGAIDISTSRINGDFTNGTILSLSTSNIAESPAAVSTSTLYYLYLKNPDATPIYSIIAPRDKFYNGRGQYLHPTDYWRCIGTVFNDQSSQIVGFVYDFNSGNYNYSQNGNNAAEATTIDTTSFDALSTTTTTYAQPLVFKGVPPMARQMSINVGTNAGDAYHKGRKFTYGHMLFQGTGGSTGNIGLVSYIENQTKFIRQSAGTGYFNTYGYYLKY